MPHSLDEEIRALRALFWSDRDPEGRVFAPLAEAYRRQGDLDQATEILADGLSRLPDFGPGRVIAGRVRRDRDELDAAEADFGAALAVDGENVEALRGLGELAAERGDTDAALEHFRRLGELEPRDEEVIERLAELEAPSAPAASVAQDVVRTTEEVVHTAAEVVVTAEETVEDAGEVGETSDVEIRVAADAAIEEQAVEDEAAAEETVEDEAPEEAEEEEARAFDVEAESETGREERPRIEEASEEGPLTRTMADLYARQGLHERALGVYRKLSRNAPDDVDLAERVAALEALAASGASGVGGGARRGSAASGGRGARSEAEVETVAREWAEGPHDTGELATPFAWTPAPTAGTASPPTGRPIRDYFQALLAWEPAEESAVPVASLAPDEIVPIASLAPGEIVPIAALAPTVVDIGSLAPDGAGGRRDVDPLAEGQG